MRPTFHLVLLAALLALPGQASATEFQPMGTLGIGGAGVARPPRGMAPYWNPGALAFERAPYGARLSAGAGVIAHEDVVADLDRLSRLDVEALENLTGSPATDQAIVTDAVQLLAVLRKIDREGGAFSVRAHAAFGQHVKRLGIGVYATGEAAVLPEVDSTNVLPEVGGSPMDAADLSALGTATPSNAFFGAGERAAIEAALGAAGVALPANVVNTFDAQLAASNEAGISSAEATDAILALAAALGSGGALDQNASALHNRGIGLVEIPLAYGHPIRLGAFGTLGVGASVKLMRGRVYVSDVTIFGLDGGDAIDELRETYEDTTTWGVDAGLLWRPTEAFGIGVVGKHLNGPSFDAPEGPDFEVKPQARAGFAFSPTGWLTLVGDLDLTENETALAGAKSRTLGGGLEIHPASWLAVRGGGYKNLAQSDASPVLTAGLTVGIPWLTLNVDAAAALDQAKYDGEEYPEEGRVEASLTVRF